MHKTNKKFLNTVSFKKVFLFLLAISLLPTVVFSSDNWMNVTLFGQKMGYYHESRETTVFDGIPVLGIHTEMISKLKRFGLDFDVRQAALVYLTNDLKPVYSRYDETMMGSQRTIISRIKNNKLNVDIIVGNETTRQVIDWKPNQQFDASLLEVIVRDGLIPGKRYEFNVFTPELGKEFKIVATVGTTQRVVAGNQWYEAIDIKQDFTGAQELSATYLVTKHGDVIKAEIGNYGMSMIKTTEQDAKALEATVEVSEFSNIPCNVDFADPESVTRLKLKITATEGMLKDMVPVDERQKWSDNTTNTEGILEITSPKGEMTFPPNWPIKSLDSKLSLFTSSSPYIESSDPDISSTARKVVGHEKNAWKAATILSDWVHQSIDNKGFDTGFASAKQTFISHRGDCTEHSVLLAALTRSIGIPTKLIVGVAAVEKGFFYHMWTEVYVGQWVSLDPTFNESRVDAGHIKLAETKTRDDEMGDYALQILKSLKKLKFEVIDYDLNGTKIVPTASSPETELDTTNSSTNATMQALEQLLNEVVK